MYFKISKVSSRIGYYNTKSTIRNATLTLWLCYLNKKGEMSYMESLELLQLLQKNLVTGCGPVINKVRLAHHLPMEYHVDVLFWVFYSYIVCSHLKTEAKFHWKRNAYLTAN